MRVHYRCALFAQVLCVTFSRGAKWKRICTRAPQWHSICCLNSYIHNALGAVQYYSSPTTPWLLQNYLSESTYARLAFGVRTFLIKAIKMLTRKMMHVRMRVYIRFEHFGRMAMNKHGPMQVDWIMAIHRDRPASGWIAPRVGSIARSRLLTWKTAFGSRTGG